MSTSIAAQSNAARKSKKSSRKSSRKANSQNLFGAAAIGCLVLGAGWAVYSNILAASVYPTLGAAGYVEPVIKRAPKVAMREAGEAVREVFAMLPVQAVAPISREMFNERFAAAAAQGVPSNAAAAAPQVAEAAPKSADAVKVAEAPKAQDPAKLADAAKARRGADAPMKLALNEPAQSARAPDARPKSGLRDMADRAKAAVMGLASHDKPSMVERLWGKPEPHGGLLAYASADASITATIAPKEQNPMLGGSPPYDRETAVYDITAKTVYLPDGTKLEAHSGLGSNLDDPRSARIRMRGVTPPHIYTLKPREALFHGVPALRLTPIGGEDAIFGRDGLLAHTFMLGQNGDSNGCVSFRDYYAFLDAYRNKGIRKLAVVARVE
ncbi:DUF2778 domain-containing protein [Bradyrhizobium sp.]|uniref:DUF2778 domain-containing protein n=1 Tax=Bradyrhizobium sp. TaxID=376 RepID=UPI00238A6774|nr:DUF2778 domain-containing protein [Bradyrhizobium sp.]MDE2378256.1 DUF2778 domain-containing protein [Bradyrhizobium sp.]